MSTNVYGAPYSTLGGMGAPMTKVAPLRYGVSQSAPAPRYAPSTPPTPAPTPAAPANPNAGPDWASMDGYDPNKENLPAFDPTTLTVNAPKTAAEFQAQNNGGTVDEAVIRDQVRKDQQARIDAANAVYDAMVAKETVSGQDRSGQTRAINARSGTLGQDFGNAADAKTTNLNNAAQETIAKERSVAILGVLNSIDQMATEKIKAKKEEALGNAKAYTDYLTKEADTAKKAVETLGTQGVTVQQLKEKAPDKLAALLKSTGYDEFSLEMALDNSRKAGEKFTYTIQDGVLIGHRTNPQTGQPEVVTKSIPGVSDGQYDQKLSADGKTVLLIPKKIDAQKPIDQQILKYNSDTVLAGAKTVKTPATKTPKPKATTPKKAFQDSIIPIINSGQSVVGGGTLLGKDGKISPQDYQSLKSYWLSKGNNPTDFDNLAKGFRDPNNTNY